MSTKDDLIESVETILADQGAVLDNHQLLAVLEVMADEIDNLYDVIEKLEQYIGEVDCGTGVVYGDDG